MDRHMDKTDPVRRLVETIAALDVAGPRAATDSDDADLTRRRRAYAKWVKDDDKSGLHTPLLRLALQGTPDELPPGMQKAHYADLEVLVHVVAHVPGPKPNFDTLQAIADVFRHEDNWRPLTEARNNGIDRRTAAAVIDGQKTGYTPHQVAKLRNVANFLVKHQDELAHASPGVFKGLTDVYGDIKDSAGQRILDRRQLGELYKLRAADVRRHERRDETTELSALADSMSKLSTPSGAPTAAVSTPPPSASRRACHARLSAITTTTATVTT